MTNSGISMVLKAMGLDPQLLLEKATQLESLAKAVGTELETRVANMDARLASIDASLLSLHQQMAMIMGPTAPAGETPYLITEHEKPKEKHNNGHHPAITRTHRGNRKVS